MMSSPGISLILLVVLTGQAPPSSQPALSPPSTSQPAASQHAAPAPKARLAVLDFKVAGKVDPTGSGVIADAVRDEFHRCGRYDLMDREMMRERMGEKDWAASVECDEVKCLVRYGTSLDVQKIVGGRIASFGETWVISIRLVDVNIGREEKLFTKDHDGKMSALLGLAREGARDIIGLPSTARFDDLPATLRLDCGNGVRMELVLIPAGIFTMGSNDGEYDEKPPHEVMISKPFYLGRYEVTQAQWQAVMGNNPSWFSAGGKGKDRVAGVDTSDHPVERVSWEDCLEYCKKLSARTGKTVRLPTEAEWEYACRAGSTGKYCFGDDENELGQYAFYGEDMGSGKTHPVGSKKPNAWSLYDMHGNVCEWCADWHGSYAAGNQKDPAGPSSGDNRVVRGSGWHVVTPEMCRCANRLLFDREVSPGPIPRFVPRSPGPIHNWDTGFRVAARAQ